MDVKKEISQFVQGVMNKLAPEYQESQLTTKTYAEREWESRKILRRYQDRVPIILIPSKHIQLKKKKFLCPKDLTVGQFLMCARKYVTIHSHQGLFLFTENGTLPSVSQLTSQLYHENQNEDGFIYLYVSLEHTFG